MGSTADTSLLRSSEFPLSQIVPCCKLATVHCCDHGSQEPGGGGVQHPSRHSCDI